MRSNGRGADRQPRDRRVIPLVMFDGFHFSQGIAGVLIAYSLAPRPPQSTCGSATSDLIAAHFTLIRADVLIPLIAGD